MFSTMAKRVNLVVKWALNPALRDRFEDVFAGEKLGNKKEKSIAAFAAIRDFIERRTPAERKAMVEAERLDVAEQHAAKIRERIGQSTTAGKPRSVIEARKGSAHAKRRA